MQISREFLAGQVDEMLQSAMRLEAWTLTKYPDGKTICSDCWIYSIDDGETWAACGPLARLANNDYSFHSSLRIAIDAFTDVAIDATEAGKILQ